MYRVRIIPSAQRDITKLKKQTENEYTKIYRRIREIILSFETNPLPYGSEKLTARGGYRIRVGPYRVLYQVDKKSREVYIVRIKRREKDTYK